MLCSGISLYVAHMIAHQDMYIGIINVIYVLCSQVRNVIPFR